MMHVWLWVVLIAVCLWATRGAWAPMLIFLLLLCVVVLAVFLPNITVSVKRGDRQ
jgi:uncharacterized membrane protein YqaE (UPF0057 family)